MRTWSLIMVIAMLMFGAQFIGGEAYAQSEEAGWNVKVSAPTDLGECIEYSDSTEDPTELHLLIAEAVQVLQFIRHGAGLSQCADLAIGPFRMHVSKN